MDPERADQPTPELIALVDTARRDGPAEGTARRVMTLTIRVGAKDFHSTQRLTAAKVKEERVESHYIFPKGYLPKGTPTELILNRALIDAETNKIIGRRAPSAYLADMRETYGAEKLLDVLESHAIQTGDDSGLESDDYGDFIVERLTAVAGLVEKVTNRRLLRDVTQAPVAGEQ